MKLMGSNQQLYVTGERYYQKPLTELGPGRHEATLLREPANEYDANAIMVRTKRGDKIGYVPKWRARSWAPYLDEMGCTELACTVEVYAAEGRPYRAELVFIDEAPG